MEKPKIVHLFDNGAMSQDEAVKNLTQLIEEVKAGNVVRYCIAAELSDGTVATGWTNANIVQRQLLISHLQVDIMWQVVLINLTQE